MISFASLSFISACGVAVLLLLLSLRSVRRKQKAKTYFKGKHVWVTGASSGIGQQVALELALRGARVTMSARSRRKMSAMAKELVSDGYTATCLPLDVSEAYATIATAHRTAAGNYGPVDILIANAGINNQGNKFAELSESTIEQVIDTNFKGTVYCVKAVLPTMIKRKRGLVAAVSSLSGYRGLPRGSVYGGTKAAISNFMEAIRVELWGSGIKFVCINPGFVDTPAVGTDHPQPFLMTSSEAAEHVLQAIAAESSHYGFPVFMEHVAMRASRVLPNFLYDPILNKLGG